ncbi:MAG: hypothetical protein RIM23_13430 [Coleofasciculus sp. G3-WIS-01]|uniref:hypothetical protein n=1 Tax=Coleofasciculus sp. G3-WIS-01 TaxID=3069528 RepID=UPI0033037C74
MLFLLERVNQRKPWLHSQGYWEILTPNSAILINTDSTIGYIGRGRYPSVSKHRQAENFYHKEATRESEDDHDCLNNRREVFNDNNDTGLETVI